MYRRTTALYLVIQAVLTSAVLDPRQDPSVLLVCTQIASSISSASSVSYPCTADDLGTILQILGNTRTPFAVKGGGHIMNPNYSSTTGVQIAMSRFDEIDYEASTSTVAVGAGNIWDNVYEALMPYNVNVVGGRVSGIGVAGFILGGGYSWLTNQYGLTLDNVLAYELVLPNGTITTVSVSSNPDLFFGLRGGYNNFGIVTTFTLATYPQGLVWGGQIAYTGDNVDALNIATANFANNVTDPKAAIITTLDYTLGSIIASVLMFYDAPTQPVGIFDEFLAIPALCTNVASRPFLDLVQVEPTNETANFRGYYNTVPLVEITDGIMNAVLDQAEASTFKHWGSALSGDCSASIISYDVEPFLPSILTHGSASAYPYARTQPFLPLNIYFSWISSSEDPTMHDAIVQSATNLTNVATAEGQSLTSAPHYPNYAIYSTSLEEIYGTALPEMYALKATYDPDNVMSLSGGWMV
ncbi:FAD dependent oxidoreductase [Laetiporus sulphureus 93-53]|uniref:FAD dependent oxidoreductase n=1 Tax=Laetiporus sulphureus 93-53 TaxID=1314785 RepID=A0A165BK52_9APHY|nr:FAD dependent oxidoreductase [Laetiporus sulphureus 93-53]KZT01207.1 FAD dependent oxidoreductase [Laetiporus sulphureus 93-53]